MITEKELDKNVVKDIRLEVKEIISAEINKALEAEMAE